VVTLLERLSWADVDQAGLPRDVLDEAGLARDAKIPALLQDRSDAEVEKAEPLGDLLARAILLADLAQRIGDHAASIAAARAAGREATAVPCVVSYTTRC
jgi:hypothetical protein